ncbi:MAG: hypothetical protein A3F83_09390 [Candidatus Glassbacteria bacterium RIFCSPLOWO2_12_FULL_58_11]|uniref:DoxX family protein n=1 Tax=Candidatus Glassbacteria bacterium RIFCSPLOWO2_12_FULL_58_11 TaxID=1817867 RepID=A0A1F5YTD9_9BACT|nr:MAG: hypothetical protein A3F83_09390 [Candidatus Glassbacteria bacterium RIFCSPLOWO2_12_FULL_58_11]
MRGLIFSFPERLRDAGLLIMRIGLGCSFMVHGWPKITGGIEFWGQIGGALENFGIGFFPVFWGFMASCSEFIGGLLLVFGLLTRPACLSLAFTMAVATSFHLFSGDNFGIYSHALKMLVVFLALALIGPGRLSLDWKIFGKPEKAE